VSKKKLKVFFHTDSSMAKTGFGRSARALLGYLYKTGKYDLVHYCLGTTFSNPSLKKTPWKSVGCLPDDQGELDRIQKDPALARMACYGAYSIDKTIKDEKPDVYFGIQDIWGVDYSVDKPWFNAINSVIWTTLDSLPILPTAVDKASKIKNYWIWSDFATKALNKLGHEHVKTLHGAIDTKYFFNIGDHEKKNLRKAHGIPLDDFIIGFVFRNQLRKTIYSLLEGFQKFKERNPKARGKSKLLLHTHFSEGWDIPKLASEYGVDMKEIITTYVCRGCKGYFVRNFEGQDIQCSSCGHKNGLVTTSTSEGVTEKQLNEVYNLMDVYAHPFTSGGQEIPIQEAKLVELITLVTNYSCGEEMCEAGAESLALDFTEYREHGTQFRKAQTSAVSIAKQLSKVYNMKPKKRSGAGLMARKWVIENFSVESVGKKIEEFLDSCKATDFDFDKQIEEDLRDPNVAIPIMEDDSEWLIWMYHNILKMKDVDTKNDGHKYWISEMEKGMGRKDIEDYFRRVAIDENQKNQTKTIEFSDLLDKDDEGKRILYVMPESIGDIYLSTSLFKNIKELYPDYNLYVACKPEFSDVLICNKYVHKKINYVPQMDSLTWLEGKGDHKGYFEIAFLPYVGTQRILTYMHNGKDKIAYKDLRYETCT
jgi:glycosyltransferase involved in cell wall biosynthesis